MRLTIFVEHRDRAGRRSLLFEIVKRARHAGVAGATVFKGRLGYGGSGRLHRSHVLAEESPLSVVIVDQPAAIDAFLEGIEDLVRDVLVVVDDVEIVGG